MKRYVPRSGPTPPRRKKASEDQWDLPLPPYEPQQQMWTWGRLMKAFTATYLVDKADATRRSYRSTFRAVVEEFGADSLPQKAPLYGWLADRVRKGELMPASANTQRGHLYKLFQVVRDDLDALVINAANFPPFDVGKQKPEGLKNPEATWRTLKQKAVDCRVLLFYAVQMFLGIRVSEALGLEWKHLKWEGTNTGGPELFITQQRSPKRAVPEPHMKHKATPTWYPLEEEELLGLFRQVSKALMRREKLYGCGDGALLGEVPCADGTTRRYIFPYRERHVRQISKWLEEAAPEEFPKRILGVRAAKKFHRFRHTFCTEVVKEIGATGEGLKAAQGLMRHKRLSTTDRYSRGAVGETVSREALRKVKQARKERLEREGEQVLEEQREAISCTSAPNSPRVGSKS